MNLVKFLAFFMVAGIAFVSCEDKKVKDTTETTTANTTGNAKELIINIWKPISTAIHDAAHDSAMKILAKTTYQFTNDGKYIITGITPDPIEMKYTISDDGKTITMTGSDGATDKVIIDKIGKDELILITSAGEKVTYSPK